jgi:hypothetical protein
MAASGRLYSVGFTAVSISAVQDLIAIYAGASKIVAIQSIELSQVTQATIGSLRWRLRYLPPTVTAGSGGSAGVISPLNPGDAAATCTARTNDTTQATTSGTGINLWSDQWNLINGVLWVPPNVNRPPVSALSGALVLSLDLAPGVGITASGTVTLEELP